MCNRSTPLPQAVPPARVMKFRGVTPPSMQSRLALLPIARHLLALACLCLYCGLAGAHGQALNVQDLAVLVDPDGVESIDSVSAPTAQARFKPLPGYLSAGYTRDVHWLRFSVAVPQAGEWWLEIQPPMLDDLRLYEPLGSGFRMRLAGDRLPFDARAVDYRAFVLPIQASDNAPHTYYLRLSTSSTSLTLLKLWRPADFHAAASSEYALFGFYHGFVLLALLVCLGVWFWLRDAMLGWFCLHVFTALPLYLGLNGFVAQYLLPASPRLTNLWVGASVFLAVSASAPFARRILRVEREQRLYYWMFLLAAWLPLLLSVSLFTGHYTEAARFIISMVMLFVLASLWRAYDLWRQGWKEGLYILIGFSFSLLGGLVSTLSALGINPLGIFLANIRQITGVGSMFAMFLALAVRLANLRDERRVALERASSAEAEVSCEREARNEQSRFIAMLSHELKTPLAVIDSATQTLERIDRSDNPEVALRHERIRRSVSRINRLVEQFLASDRIDAESMRPRLTKLDLADLLRQTADSSAEGARRLHLELPEALACQADAALLRVALLNLLDNALKYSPDDSPIEVRAQPLSKDQRPGIEVVVANAGSGIPRELRARLFNRYARGENTGQIPGAGLGLHLVRRIAELHGGGVELGERARGTAFHLWLPAGQT